MIPDNAAAIRQKTNSFHILRRASNTCVVIALFFSFSARKGRRFLLNVKFGYWDITGNDTFIRGCSEHSLLFRNNDELRVARLWTQEFATRQTWSFYWNWLSFERTLSNLNSSQRKPIHEQLLWFSDRQKILAFKIVKTNKSVLKDILREVPLLAAITILHYRSNKTAYEAPDWKLETRCNHMFKLAL